MKLEITHKNYCATVVKIEKLLPLDKCDFVQAAIILNSQVIVGKDVKIGDIGIFFPVECSLNNKFLTQNNLYSSKEMNLDPEKKGYFSDKGRVKCQKFRGHQSEGCFFPLDLLTSIIPEKTVSQLKVADEFNIIDGIKVCEKYVIKVGVNKNVKTKAKKAKKAKKTSILVDKQFRLHFDTENLKRKAYVLNPKEYVSISNKKHGTSWVAGKVLCKKKLSIRDKIAKFLGANIIDTEYKLVCSSRNVIKNEFETDKGFYKYDLWTEIGKKVEFALLDGMTMYGEALGFLPSGSPIQQMKGIPYAYGCEENIYKYFVYRITMTNPSGNVLEMPYLQMCEYLSKVGIDSPDTIYYGTVEDFVLRDKTIPVPQDEEKYEEFIRELFLKKLDSMVTDKMCPENGNKVPLEGVVVRKDKISQCENYKFKNYLFLDWETKQLDEGTVDIETITEEDETEEASE